MVRREHVRFNTWSANYSRMARMGGLAVEARMCSRIENGKGCANKAAGTHRWCKDCKARYQKEYAALRVKMAYSEGASAMRAAIVLQFANLGMMPIAGIEVARHVRKMEIPERAIAELSEE